MSKTLSELFEEFVEISEPEECGCEFQHDDWCLTMQWKRKISEIRKCLNSQEESSTDV